MHLKKTNWKSIIYLKVPPSPPYYIRPESRDRKGEAPWQNLGQSPSFHGLQTRRGTAQKVFGLMIVGTRSALILLRRARGVKEISDPGSSQPDSCGVAATLSDKRFGEF